MEIVIIEEKENPFFKRKDLKVRIKHLGDPTPSKAYISKELASKYQTDESQVKIGYIFSHRGVGESSASCKILQEKQEIEPESAKEVKEGQTKERTEAEGERGGNGEAQASAAA